ncbi:MAG TPA: dihydroorotase [Phnomibacter sp.]|nr:dihydroorotase [Phnomibacter sp.]
MSALLLRQVTIADPRSTQHGQQVDILIEEGKISAIGELGNAKAQHTVEATGLFVSPGFTDIFSHFCDPGIEYKETLESGAAAAAAGGYCRVLVLPNTEPAVHNKTQVEYIVQKSKSLPVQVLPYGAISKNCEGKDLAEMYDMRNSGAIAFSDGTRPVQNSQVLTKAMQYVKAFDGVVVQVPDETALSKSGLIHEGVISTQLGLPGKPSLAETLLLNRDIELLRYTGSKLHVTGISTAASVELVRRAKAEGLQLSCSVTPYHLSFCDEDLQEYDTNLKVNPPLRTRQDVQALQEAVLDGTIDCIASHHQPHEYDSKVCEFEYAKYGMEGLETCFAAVTTALPQLSVERLVELFAIQPSAIFGLPLPAIEIGAPAMLTLFSKEVKHQVVEADIRSIAKNNAFIGKQLTGKAIGIITNNYTNL